MNRELLLMSLAKIETDYCRFVWESIKCIRQRDQYSGKQIAQRVINISNFLLQRCLIQTCELLDYFKRIFMSVKGAIVPLG